MEKLSDFQENAKRYLQACYGNILSLLYTFQCPVLNFAMTVMLNKKPGVETPGIYIIETVELQDKIE